MRSATLLPETTPPSAPATPRLRVPSVTVPERVHYDEHLLLWQVRGGSALLLDGVDHALQAGHAIWVPASTRHRLHLRENSVMLPLFFDVDDSATTLSEVATHPVDDELRMLFLAYIQSQQTIIQPDADIARQILSAIERRPARSTSLPMPTSAEAAAIAAALRFNPGDGRSAEEMAAQVHASLRTIERAFKAETGMTLREWRIRNRLESAVDLVRTTRSVEAVAHRVGYTTTGAFRRVFKECFGMTPSQYVSRHEAR